MIPEGIPQRTLGWGVLEWGSKFLAQPDGDNVGDRWAYTNEQAKFILWLYAVDEQGKFIYRHGMLSRPKGWGKSPLLAALCCTELLGPVVFSHFDDNGNAVGKPRPMAYVQIVATAFEQTENTMSLVIEMLGQGPARDHYGLDLGLTRVRAPGGAKLERVTAASKSKEGQRPSFAVLDETHLWVDTNGGPELFATIKRNLGKVGGRLVQTTNAPVPGEESVAELTDRAWAMIKEGNAAPDLLYDNREVVIEDIYDKAEAMPLLRYLYGDSLLENGGWVDLERIWEEIVDPLETESNARRFYFNQRVRRGSAWIKSSYWVAQGRDDLKLRRGDRIALGFRGQTRKGSTAVVACRLRDGAIFVLKAWETEPSNEASEINYVDVDDFVKDTLDRYNVVLMFAAPQNWQDIVGRWYEAHEDVVEEFWTNQKLKMAKAIEQFETAVYSGRLVHSESDILTRHVDNCYVEETPSGKLIRKVTSHSPNYISVAEAAVLAYEAAQEAIVRGLDTEGPSGVVYSF